MNEYQYFSKVLDDIEQVLFFKRTQIDERVFEQLDTQDKQDLLTSFSEYRLKYNLDEIMDYAKFEIADSMFFHATDLNNEIYNYAWEIYHERLEKKQAKEEQKKKDDNKEKPRGLSGTLMDPNRMTVINVGLFLVIAIVLFYFGWGLEWINESHIT